MTQFSLFHHKVYSTLQPHFILGESTSFALYFGMVQLTFLCRNVQDAQYKILNYVYIETHM